MPAVCRAGNDVQRQDYLGKYDQDEDYIDLKAYFKRYVKIKMQSFHIWHDIRK